MSRTTAGHENNLLEDSLLDVALETEEDTGDDWLSREVALLGLNETRETDKSVTPLCLYLAVTTAQVSQSLKL